MNVAKEIRRVTDTFSEGYVFTASDFNFNPDKKGAVVKALNRMVKSKELMKLSKGKFYKPRQSMFGLLKPMPYQMVKDFIKKDGKRVGYITGYTAFSSLGLTTQISSAFHIGTNKYRRKLVRNKQTILFIVQPNTITRKNVEILRILDAIRFIKEIPGTSTDQACKTLKGIVGALNEEQTKMFVQCALKYTSYVRALCGALLEEIGGSPSEIDTLRKSLNGVSTYKMPLSESVLPTKRNWRII